METKKDYSQDISEIRSMMERSSRFISLSGLSGVFAGIYALAGAAAAYFYLDLGSYDQYYEAVNSYESIRFILLDALFILIVSMGTVVMLTTRRARKNGQQISDTTGRRLIINLMIPFVSGAVFCLAQLYQGNATLVLPSTLIFYGIALLNGSKYTFNDIRYLGVTEIILGLISSFSINYGFYFWIFGFGILHIVYGTVLYFKYDRK